MVKNINRRHLLARCGILALFALVIVISALATASPAQANVTGIVLYRRSCGQVTVYTVYDGFSEGNPPFFVVFAVDLNGNGNFGEAHEPIQYRPVGAAGAASVIGARLTFTAVPEGTTISVTAYEVDSAGKTVSKPLSPVQYVCHHKPDFNAYPPNTGIVVPGAAVTAKINVAALQVYSAPTIQSTVLGGLPKGARANVVARNERGDWLEIQFQGGLGWIMWQTNALIFGPFDTLPVLPNAESAASASS